MSFRLTKLTERYKCCMRFNYPRIFFYSRATFLTVLLRKPNNSRFSDTCSSIVDLAFGYVLIHLVLSTFDFARWILILMDCDISLRNFVYYADYFQGSVRKVPDHLLHPGLVMVCTMSNICRFFFFLLSPSIKSFLH